MAYPVSPSNNQTTIINGIVYVYNSSNNSWTRQQPYSDVGNAYNKANSAYVLAQASYDYANTFSVSALQAAFDKANSALSSSASAVNFFVDRFTGNGTTTDFSLNIAPVSINNTTVNYNGVVLQRDSYSLVGNTLQLSEAPANGSIIEVSTANLVSISSSATVSGGSGMVQFNTLGALDSRTSFMFHTSNNTLSVYNFTANGTTNISGYTTSDLTQYIFDKANSQVEYTQASFSRANNSYEKANTVLNYANDSVIMANAAFEKANQALEAANSTFNIFGGTTANTFTFTNTSDSVLTLTGGINIGGLTRLTKTQEKLTSISGATGTVTHDLNGGMTFIHSGIAANFTANFTNFPTYQNYATPITLILSQGATARYATGIQINGSTLTLKWVGGIAGGATPYATDLQTVVIINNGGSYTALTSISSFS